ncbi:MAG: hypothetical protein U0176_25915 [Bacteroidia bacterium]
MSAQIQTADPDIAGLRSPSPTASSECNQFCLETLGLQGMGVLVIVLSLKLPVAEILSELLFPQAKVVLLALCAGILLGWARLECLVLGLLFSEKAVNPQLIERLGLIGGIVLLFSSAIPFILAASIHWSDLDRGVRRLYAFTATVVYAEVVLIAIAVVSFIYFVWGFYSSSHFG